MGLQLRPAMAPAFETAASTMTTPNGNDYWNDLAARLWMNDKKSHKVNPEIIKAEIWDPLQSHSFALRSLADLESLQILERYVRSSVRNMF